MVKYLLTRAARVHVTHFRKLLRLGETSGELPCSSRASFTGDSGPCPNGFLYFQGNKYKKKKKASLNNLYQGLVTLTVKEFWCLDSTSCVSVRHYAPLGRTWLFAPFLQIYIDIDKISLLFSRLIGVNSFSLLIGELFQSFYHLHELSLDSL